MLRSITSFFLIFIVLLGTVGFSYDAHYCGGVLVNQKLSIVQSDLSCGMAMKENVASQPDENERIEPETCCENHHLSFEISDDFKDVQSASFFYVPCHSFPSIEGQSLFFSQEKEYDFIGYSPPPLYRDIVLLKESFLI